MNLALPEGYAFDVTYSETAFLEDSTNINVLITPNNDVDNVLKQYEIIGTKIDNKMVYSF